MEQAWTVVFTLLHQANDAKYRGMQTILLLNIRI